MKEKLETRIKELEELLRKSQDQELGLLHRIDELKLLLKQIEEQKG